METALTEWLLHVRFITQQLSTHYIAHVNLNMGGLPLSIHHPVPLLIKRRTLKEEEMPIEHDGILQVVMEPLVVQRWVRQ